MESNIFIENSEVIKDHYIVSFVGEPNINKYYVNSSLPQEWIKAFKSHKQKIITKSAYEKRLISYFENPVLPKTNHPIVLLVGSVGSGKSSSVRYAMHKANICRGCILEKSCPKNYPDRVLVDFLKFMKNLDHESEEQEEYEVTEEVYDIFWQHIINILDESINNEMTLEKEVREFWPWLVNYKNKHHSFYYFIDIYRDEILDAKTPFNRLRSLRDKFRMNLLRKDLAYYKLFHIAFLRNELKVKCNFLLFDNMDTLPPLLQREIVKFCEDAYTHLSSKSILLVRPLTYLRNRDGGNFMEKIDHSKASLKEVFLERLKRLQKDKLFGEDTRVKNAKSLISSLEKAIQIFPNNRTYSDVFVSTSGRSIRFGLKNFYNFLLSPLLITHREGTELEEIKIDANKFFQAYFCGENDPQWIDDKNFVNLFSESHSATTKYLSNLKLRIIDIMCRHDIIQTNELVDSLESFGYKIHSITKALNDLLRNRKALIWSSHVTSYELKDIRDCDHHIIRLTELGFRYYKKLLTYLNYLRECFVPIDGYRHFGGAENLSNIYKFVKLMEEEDLKQIEHFIICKGLFEYEKLYPKQVDSLSSVLWSKISESMSFQHIRYPDIIVDIKREEYIKKRTKELKKSAVEKSS